MRIAELPAAEALRQFRAGLSWRVGPFVVHLATPIRFVARQLAFLYADYPLATADEIVDAYVVVRRNRPFSRYLSVFVDGHPVYRTIRAAEVVPMVEWTLNLCVFHRPSVWLSMHAAVVERNGRCALLPGAAGAGKSTLCAALMNRGWRLFSDEVALIGLEDGIVIPAPRPISLKESSIDRLAQFAPQAVFGPVWPDTAKGRLAHMLPSPESVARMDEPGVPAWVVVPIYQPGVTATLVKLPEAQAFMECAGNAFNYDILGERGFHALSRLITSCQCLALAYDDLKEASAAFDSLTATVHSPNV